MGYIHGQYVGLLLFKGWKSSTKNVENDIFVTEEYKVNTKNLSPKREPGGYVFNCIPCTNNFQLSITFGPKILDVDKNFFDSVINDKSKLKEFAKISVENQIPIKDGVEVNIINIKVENRFGIKVINYLAQVSIFNTEVFENSYLGEYNNRIVKITINYYKENFSEFDENQVYNFLDTLEFKNENG